MPTSKEYKELTDDQIELLYINFIKAAPDESIRRTYWKSKEAEENDIIKSLPEDHLEKMGYSKQDIEKIKQDLES